MESRINADANIIDELKRAVFMNDDELLQEILSN